MLQVLHERSKEETAARNCYKQQCCLVYGGLNTPDTSECTLLKLAGLGEKQFPVFAYGSSQELQADFVY